MNRVLEQDDTMFNRLPVRHPVIFAVEFLS